jgi:hypothetical protein
MVNLGEVASEGACRAFAAWVIAVLYEHGDMPVVLTPLVAKLSEMWRDSDIDDDALLEAKVVMWDFLRAKHGDSTTIADAEDRTVRAALTIVEHPAYEYDIADCRDWVLEMIPQAAS